MAQKFTISPSKLITIDGTKFNVRTITTWNDNGTQGNITQPEIVAQYREEGPFATWKPLADRTGNQAVNNGWSFRPAAGQGFKKELNKTGPNSLTAQLDNASVEQLAKYQGITKARAQNALKDVAISQKNKTILAAANQDPNAPAGGLNAAQARSSGAEPFQLSENISAKNGTRVNFQTLVYPPNMSADQDRLKIDILEFKPRAFKGLTFADRDQTVNTENSKGSVTLPIPGNVTDDNRVSWGSQNMNTAEAAVAAAALKTIQDGGQAAVDMTLKSFKELMDDPDVAGNVSKGFASFFVGEAAGVQGLLARTEGAVLNPNTELLFQGPSLRSFSFSFKLTPRSEAEAKTVRSIIRFFKQGMAVQRTKKDLFLKAPMIFKLQFLKGSSELHTFLPRVKLCALLGCSVNYTPEGNYATYRDSSMVSYEMSLTFNELDPIFNDDYGNGQNGQDTDIGF